MIFRLLFEKVLPIRDYVLLRLLPLPQPSTLVKKRDVVEVTRG